MAERARISRIQVTNLFGIFNHEIRLNLDERITILHGPNGFGKTIILQMVDGLFRKQWERLRTVPFDEFLIEFDDGAILQVRQESKPSKVGERRIPKSFRALVFSFVGKTGVKSQSFSYRKIGGAASKRSVSYEGEDGRIIRFVLHQDSHWHESRSGEMISLDKARERYGVTPDMVPAMSASEPDWMKSIRGQLGIHLIHTQRLGVIGDHPWVSS